MTKKKTCQGFERWGCEMSFSPLDQTPPHHLCPPLHHTVLVITMASGQQLITWPAQQCYELCSLNKHTSHQVTRGEHFLFLPWILQVSILKKQTGQTGKWKNERRSGIIDSAQDISWFPSAEVHRDATCSQSCFPTTSIHTHPVPPTPITSSWPPSRRLGVISQQCDRAAEAPKVGDQRDNKGCWMVGHYEECV